MMNGRNTLDNDITYGQYDKTVITALHGSIYKMYINHTDAGGIVYHGNYLTFYENCRRDWFTELGFDSYFFDSKTIDGQNVVYQPVVTDARVRYLKPILLDMKVLVTIDEVKIKPASLIFTQSIYHTDTDNVKNRDKLSTSSITIACVSHSTEPAIAVDKINEAKNANNTLKVARLPTKLVEAITNWHMSEM